MKSTLLHFCVALVGLGLVVKATADPPASCEDTDSDSCYISGQCGSHNPGSPYFCCFTFMDECCACTCVNVQCSPVYPGAQCPSTGKLTYNCAIQSGKECRQGPTYQYCAVP